MFGFQRLDVYKAAVGFLGLACKLLSKIPRGNADLNDQLRRAALSVPLNIAEGVAGSAEMRCAFTPSREAQPSSVLRFSMLWKR